MIERIELNDKLYALILRREFEREGANFLTPKDNSLQVGILIHKKGTQITPHVHRASPRTIKDVQEVLYLEHGKVEAEFYDDSGRKVKNTTLIAGDTILLLSGGHGFNILEDTKMIEVKQGPYLGVKEDKEYLEIRQ